MTARQSPTAPSARLRYVDEGTESESALISRVRAGDVDAYEVLVRRHQDTIYRTALRMLGNPEDAEDVAQDVVVVLWAALRGFQETSSLSTWLYRIVVNRCLNEIRRRRLTRPVIDSDLVSAPAAEDIALDRAEFDLACRAVTELAPELRSALVLHELEGLTYQEVATVLQVSHSTVRGRIHRARGAVLRALIDDPDRPTARPAPGRAGHGLTAAGISR